MLYFLKIGIELMTLYNLLVKSGAQEIVIRITDKLLIFKEEEESKYGRVYSANFGTKC